MPRISATPVHQLPNNWYSTQSQWNKQLFSKCHWFPLMNMKTLHQWLSRLWSQITSASEIARIAPLVMACHMVRSLWACRLLAINCTCHELRVLEFKGSLVRPYQLGDGAVKPLNPVILFIPVGLLLLLSWTSPGDRATLRMTEALWRPLASVTTWCSAKDSLWKSIKAATTEIKLESSQSWSLFSKMTISATTRKTWFVKPDL